MFGRSRSEKANAKSIDGMKGQQKGRKQLGADAQAKIDDSIKVQKLQPEEAVLDAKVLPWKADPAVEEAEQKAAQDKAQAEIQQNRIISFFSVEAKVEVTPEEIVGMDSRSLKDLKRARANDLRRAAIEEDDPKVTREEREAFLQRLAEGKVTARDENNFLLLVCDMPKDAALDFTQKFEQIAMDSRQTQILAVAAGYNLTNWKQVDKEALTKLLTDVQDDGDDYRTPVGFLKLRRHFLEGIRSRTKEQVYKAYVHSMNELEMTLYGVRLDYFRQFELLRHEARKLMPTSTTESVRPTEARFEVLTSERSAEIMGRAVIEGDPWRGGGLERHLSTHALTLAKLVPLFALRIDGLEVGLSDIFQLPGGRAAVMAYVLVQDEVKVRTYYRTNTQGFWHYLPDYTRRADGKIDFYCIGYGEESVTLPMEVQAVLARIEAERGVKVLPNTADSEFLAAGTAFAYDTRQDYQMQWSYGRMRGDYYQEVSAEPVNHDFDIHGSNQKKAPYTLSIDYNRSPDFEARTLQYEIETTDAGHVIVDGFKSYDGQYNWLFCRDSKDRAWVGAVEAISPMTSMGLRRDWIALGDFMTALYEHTSQAGIYGDRNDTKGARQCMWNNYLSNIPLIQEYLRKVGAKNE